MFMLYRLLRYLQVPNSAIPYQTPLSPTRVPPTRTPYARAAPCPVLTLHLIWCYPPMRGAVRTPRVPLSAYAHYAISGTDTACRPLSAYALAM
eukprot:3884846-Rhodomonas_salina.3